MRSLFIVLFLFGLSCRTTETKSVATPVIQKEEFSINDTFQALLDSAGVKGSILILSDGTYHSNNFEWSKIGRLPASTFKIPNSIIALETGVMIDDSVKILWDGEPRYQKRWEQDLSFINAFHYSCVPCYQQIAREIGTGRMNNYLDKFGYGTMVFDSTTLDNFWLEGDSKISQFEQINFLKTLNEQRLPISANTYTIIQRMMVISEFEGAILRGKTGWSFQNNIDNCWYVGYVEMNNDFYYFATNIEPTETSKISDLKTVRKTVTHLALESLGVIHLD
jgi:beta-lactamase class D